VTIELVIGVVRGAVVRRVVARIAVRVLVILAELVTTSLVRDESEEGSHLAP
jgi:hypothetical protein